MGASSVAEARSRPTGSLGGGGKAGRPGLEPGTAPEVGGAGRLVQPRCVQWIMAKRATEEQPQGPRMETWRALLRAC